MPRKNDKKKRAHESRPGAGAKRTTRSPFLSNAIILCAILFLFAVLLYGAAVKNDFVWDDRDLIVENQSIRTLDGSGVKALFLENFWENKDRLGGYYRPLVMLSYKINYAIFGMNPAGFHAVNVIVNALVSVLLFLLMLTLFADRLLALLTALLFTALPLHTENVAWIAGRTDVFATFWMLLSALFFVAAGRRAGRALLLLSLIAFFFALLAKEIAVVLPFILLIVDRTVRASGPRGNDSRNNATRQSKFPRFFSPAMLFIIPLAFYLLLRNAAIGTGVTTYTHTTAGAAAKILLALSIVAGYAAKLFYPFRLSAEYDAPVPGGPVDAYVVAGFLVIAGIVYAAIRFRSRGAVFLGIAFLSLGTVPVLNLIPLGEISAERFLYFPSIGFALLAALLFARMLEHVPVVLRYFPLPPGAGSRPRTPGAGIAALCFIALIAAYSVRTVTRIGDWRNEEVLFAATVAASPTSARAHMNLGNVYWRNKRTADATEEYRKALDIDPDYVEALSNLAGVYQSQKKNADAARLLERALAQAPDNTELLNNLGILYLGNNRFADARRVLERAVQNNPRHLRAQYNLGIACLMQEDLAAALPHFETVKNTGDEFALAYYYIGLISVRTGNKPYAKEQLERYLQSPNASERYRQRSSVLLRQIEQPAAKE